MIKKRVLLLAAVFTLVLGISAASAVNLYPSHDVETFVKPPVSRVIVCAYDTMHENQLVELVEYALAAEDTELWLYPVCGTNENILLTATDECMKTIFPKYIEESRGVLKSENVVQAALDFLSSKTGVEKIFCSSIYLGMDDRYTYESMSAYVPAYPDVKFTYNDIGGGFEGAMYDSSCLDISSLGYESCPYADYDRREAKLTIEAGKADDNLLVVARASKSDLLYISGYLASESTAAKYADKNKIKGVSLGYNHVNIAKNASPKNMAMAMFTINDEVGDTATEAFEVVIKNAESVQVYYKSSPGGGVASAAATYDKSQDDAIKNLENPDEAQAAVEEANKPDILGFIDADNVEEGSALSVAGKVFNVVKSVIAAVFTIVFGLFRILLLVFIILMIFSKKFRANVMLRVYRTKYGPKIKVWLDKLVSFISSMFAVVPKMKGNASLKGDFAFISYAKVDMHMPGSIVQALITELEKAGVNCWTFEKGIPLGQDYNEVLPEAIENCKLMIVFLSPESATSAEVESEVVGAKRYDKIIMPVKISDFDLFGMSKWQHMLSHYNVKELYSNKPQDMAGLVAEIKAAYMGNK